MIQLDGQAKRIFFLVGFLKNHQLVIQFLTFPMGFPFFFGNIAVSNVSQVLFCWCFRLGAH